MRPWGGRVVSLGGKVENGRRAWSSGGKVLSSGMRPWGGRVEHGWWMWSGGGRVVSLNGKVGHG